MEKFGDLSRHHGLPDVTNWGARAASLPPSAASRNACRYAQSSNVEIGSRQAAANYRPAACAPRKITSAARDDGVYAATKISSLAGSTRTGL